MFTANSILSLMLSRSRELLTCLGIFTSILCVRALGEIKNSKVCVYCEYACCQLMFFINVVFSLWKWKDAIEVVSLIRPRISGRWLCAWATNLNRKDTQISFLWSFTQIYILYKDGVILNFWTFTCLHRLLQRLYHLYLVIWVTFQLSSLAIQIRTKTQILYWFCSTCWKDANS